MEFYIYVNKDGSISGFSKFPPAGHTFPRVVIPENDVEFFRANFFDYKYIDGKLIKPETPAEDEKQDQEFQKQIRTQHKIAAMTIQNVAMNTSEISSHEADINSITKRLDELEAQHTNSELSSNSTSATNSAVASESQSVSESVSTTQSNASAESGVK